MGSPVYFFDVAAQLRAFMERCTSLMKAYWHTGHPHPPPDWSRTAAGALAIGSHRHGGQEHTCGTIINWFLTCGFVVVGSHSLREGPAGYIGGSAWQGAGDGHGVEGDRWGLEAARIVGQKVAKTALLLNAGAEVLEIGER